MSGDLSKLPAWARSRIENAEGALSRAEAELARAVLGDDAPDVRIALDNYVSPIVPLPDRGIVFTTGFPAAEYPHEQPRKVRATLTRPWGEKEDVLELHADGNSGLVVIPGGHNMLWIRVERHPM